MPILDLPKTKLALHADEMVRYGPGDAVVARYPTDEITRVGLEKSQELALPCVMVAVFASLAFVSYEYISSPGWSLVAVIACFGICAFALLSIDCRKIVLETTNGTVRYHVADLFEEAEGFVLSANSRLALGRLENANEPEKQLVDSETA